MGWHIFTTCMNLKPGQIKKFAPFEKHFIAKNNVKKT